jgi:hypothetical protein
MKLKSTTQRLLFVVIACVLAVGLVPLLPPHSTKASFNANRLIDDTVFNDTNSMTAGQVDSFLNQFPNSCISTNHGFSSRDPVGYSPSSGYQFGGNTSAGNVIVDAAHAYDLNPRALIVTLQKEQSLVTGGSCSTLRYAAAVGYGCPDSGTTHDYSGIDLYTLNGNTVTSVSGTCVNSSVKVGFSQQVIRAAWLLKFGQQRSLGNYNWAIVRGSWNNSDDQQSCYSGPMTQGYRRICPSGQDTYYDGYLTIDGTSTHMDTGATAALYWYTPHFHGNQNFVSLWEGWFGSTSAPSFAWENVDLFILDENRATYIPTNNMHAGDRLFVTVKVKNTGTSTWYRDGPNPMTLGTYNAADHSTPYCDSTWTRCNRAARLTESTVAPGDVGHFDFYMSVPNNVGEFREYFKPVAEFQSWMENDTGFHIYVNDNNSFDWRWEYYEAYTDSSKTTPVDINNLARGQKIFLVLHTLNNSARLWTNSGQHAVDLGTSIPQDHNSVLCTTGWMSCNRPVTMDQTQVYPGGDATFSFYAQLPNQVGQVREYFKPVLEYTGWTRDDSNHIFLNVTH